MTFLYWQRLKSALETRKCRDPIIRPAGIAPRPCKEHNRSPCSTHWQTSLLSKVRYLVCVLHFYSFLLLFFPMEKFKVCLGAERTWHHPIIPFAQLTFSLPTSSGNYNNHLFQTTLEQDFLLLSGLWRRRHWRLLWELEWKVHFSSRGNSDHKERETRSWLQRMSDRGGG